MKKLKGISPRSIRILTDDNQPGTTYSTPDQIAEAPAKTCSAVSADSNHSNDFLHYKTLVEQQTVHFENSNQVYNQQFTMHEMEWALADTKDSAPGEDGVHYRMVKNMLCTSMPRNT